MFLKTNENDTIKVVQPNQSLNYINCDYFKSHLNELCPIKEKTATKTLLENVLYNNNKTNL